MVNARVMHPLCGVTICICLCISTVTRAQMHGFSFSLADSMPLLAQHIYVDPFGNRYWISPQGIFFKQDIHTDSLYQYSNWNAGIPEQADVSNPLQVLLFYPLSARIYFLSRWLTPLHVLDLKSQGILQPTAVALSYDNQIWVFDLQDGMLKKITRNGRLLLQSVPFSQLVHRLFRPTRIIDSRQQLYLYDPRLGIAVCDELANFQTFLPVSSSRSFAAAGKNLYVLRNDSVLLFRLPFGLLAGMHLPAYMQPREIAAGSGDSHLLLLGTRALYILQLSEVSNN
jgi:hypothetical protein